LAHAPHAHERPRPTACWTLRREGAAARLFPAAVGVAVRWLSRRRRLSRLPTPSLLTRKRGRG
jgi:hypothetical protein